MMQDKYQALLNELREMDGVVVAFSGGADSSLLALAAREALGDRALAVTAKSPTYTERELEHARNVAAGIGIRHQTIETDEIDDPDYKRNPMNRCFYCKRTLFTALKALAEKEGLPHVVEGSNKDDGYDFRPGMQAARQLCIRAPLADAGLTKEEIRVLSKEKNLPTWDKPSMACLASRIPYGEEITRERLQRIDRAEEVLRSHGVGQVRVRDHGSLARIELAPDQISRFLEPERRKDIVGALKEAGYLYVTLDLEGYRTGAMNEPLRGKNREKK